MDSDDDDYYENYETEQWDDYDNGSVPVTKAPSFETLTADDIIQLMNQYIEQVNAIIQVKTTIYGLKTDFFSNEN